MTGSPEDRGAEKAVFYCVSCGFAGDMYEDFVDERSPEAMVYYCPECSAAVVEQPVPTGD